MPALEPGTRAPEFTLPDTNGNTFRLSEALADGPVVLAFFKITCPVCQYAFPFYDRVFRATRGTGVTFIGVSQHEEDDAERFMREYDVTFRVVLDNPRNYAVSNAYGITHVPTLFLIGPDGTIEMTNVSWSRQDTEALHERLKKHDDATPPIFKPGEQVADFKAG